MFPLEVHHWFFNKRQGLSPLPLVPCLESMCPSSFPFDQHFLHMFKWFSRENLQFGAKSEEMGIQRKPELPLALIEC